MNENTRDVRDASIDELIEEYGRLRGDADTLPMDDPNAVEVELLYMLVESVFNGARIE
jgi:hypothetical protein